MYPVALNKYFLSMMLAFLSSEISAEIFLFSSGNQFHGCLDCEESDQHSICNRYGKFGSLYQSTSIWNANGIGNVGRRYSPFSDMGIGLKMADTQGNFKGNLSISEKGDKEYSQSLKVIWGANQENYSAVRNDFCALIKKLNN
ncbi:MAG: hypothetical protein ISR26_08760 [Porticoccaceae bacterium]|nr:hypothetical protein [Porticoccaceae bacterium]